MKHKLRLCSFEIMPCNLIYTLNIKIHKVNSICQCYRLLRASKYFIDCYIWWKYNSGKTDLGFYLIWRKFSRFYYYWGFFFLVCHSLLLLSPLYKMLLWFPYSNAFSILFIFLSYWQLSVLWQVVFMVIYSKTVWKKRKVSDLRLGFKRLHLISL